MKEGKVRSRSGTKAVLQVSRDLPPADDFFGRFWLPGSLASAQQQAMLCTSPTLHPERGPMYPCALIDPLPRQGS